jgi:hypothetical protein
MSEKDRAQPIGQNIKDELAIYMGIYQDEPKAVQRHVAKAFMGGAVAVGLLVAKADLAAGAPLQEIVLSLRDEIVEIMKQLQSEE